MQVYACVMCVYLYLFWYECFKSTEICASTSQPNNFTFTYFMLDKFDKKSFEFITDTRCMDVCVYDFSCILFTNMCRSDCPMNIAFIEIFSYDEN